MRHHTSHTLFIKGIPPRALDQKTFFTKSLLHQQTFYINHRFTSNPRSVNPKPLQPQNPKSYLRASKPETMPSLEAWKFEVISDFDVSHLEMLTLKLLSDFDIVSLILADSCCLTRSSLQLRS